ncbi:MAG: transglycosylase domain-containing protein [Verrucomicrobiales bacterium]|nr:transglycosylase domain-containing protein [Verrucomicrobiales bacterium]
MKGRKKEIIPESNWRGPTGLKQPFYKRAWFSVLMALILLGGVAAVTIVAVVVTPLREQADTYDLTELSKLEAASVIFDRTGTEMARFYMQNRVPVAIKEVPQHFIDALVAQEDSRFFQHQGVDYIGLIRAIWLNFRAGEVTQGASTITQQLARNTYELRERSYKRKILEAFLALRIEKHVSKQEILEFYLNRIYFGSGFYGIQSAAKGYFGKDAKGLTVEESATIVGLMKGPNRLSPLRHPDDSIKSRNWVLERMTVEGYLTPAESRIYQAKPLITAPQVGNAQLSYSIQEVRRQFIDMVGDEKAAVGGFQVYTTLDQALQKTADEALQRRLLEVEKRPNYGHQTYLQFNALLSDYKAKLSTGAISPSEPMPKAAYLQGASLIIENETGAILAMVGGRDFTHSNYNIALSGKRSVGTAFTPMLYAAAFSQPELFPGTMVEDAPIGNDRVMIGGLTGILGEWGTEKLESTWPQKPITAREALVESRNAATVRLGELLGRTLQDRPGAKEDKRSSWMPAIAAVKELAFRAGIESEVKELPASFLGVSEARLDEMCLAYSTFANSGRRAPKLHIIQRVTDAEDNIVFQVAEADRNMVQAMDEVAAFQTHSCLADALHRGTGNPAVSEFGLGSYECAGKTGTGYGFKDLWFMGYTSAVTCGVWVGFDNHSTIYEGAFSNKVALPIWTDIMNAAELEHPGSPITPPPTLERVDFCNKSGMRATDFCYELVPMKDGTKKSVKATHEEYVRPGMRMDGFCTEHTSEGIASDILAFRHIGLGIGEDSIGSIDDGKYAHIEPVRMVGLTILGRDPFNSVQPVPRATVVNDDGTEARKAEPVEAIDEAPPEVPIKLEPVPRLKIEIDEPHPTATARTTARR